MRLIIASLKVNSLWMICVRRELVLLVNEPSMTRKPVIDNSYSREMCTERCNDFRCLELASVHSSFDCVYTYSRVVVVRTATVMERIKWLQWTAESKTRRGSDLRTPTKSFIKAPAFELLAAASVSTAGPQRLRRARWLRVVLYRMSRCNSHPFERTRPHMMNCEFDVCDVHCLIVVDCRSISVVPDQPSASRSTSSAAVLAKSSPSCRTCSAAAAASHHTLMNIRQ